MYTSVGGCGLCGDGVCLKKNLEINGLVGGQRRGEDGEEDAVMARRRRRHRCGHGLLAFPLSVPFTLVFNDDCLRACTPDPFECKAHKLPIDVRGRKPERSAILRRTRILFISVCFSFRPLLTAIAIKLLLQTPLQPHCSYVCARDSRPFAGGPRFHRRIRGIVLPNGISVHVRIAYAGRDR